MLLLQACSLPSCACQGASLTLTRHTLYSRVLAPKRSVAPTGSCRGALGRIQTPSTFVRWAVRTTAARVDLIEHLAWQGHSRQNEVHT